MVVSASGWIVEIPQQRAGSGLLAHELTHTLQQRGGTSAARDSHDRFANADTSHLLSRSAGSRGAGAKPAASGRLKPRQKMVGHSAGFVHFFTGKDDAKMASLQGHRATGHRRIEPAQFQAKLGQAQSILVGVAIPSAAVGHRYPNLTLKRGTMVIDIEDAVITHRDGNQTALRPGLVIVKSYSTSGNPSDDPAG